MKQARALLWVAVGSILILADALAVGPPCDMTGPAVVCPGTSNGYSVTPTDGATYEWLVSGNGGIAGSSTAAALVMTSNVPGEIIISAAVWDVNATTNSCSVTVSNVGVVALTASEGSDPSGVTNYVSWSETGVVTATASLSPPASTLDYIPTCYDMSKDGISLAQATTTTIDKSVPAATTVTATAGSSSAKQTTIVPRVRVYTTYGADVTDTTITVPVGKKIGLVAHVLPDGIAVESRAWSVPGSVVKAYTQASASTSATVTEMAAQDYTQSEIGFYWKDGGDGRVVTLSVVLGGNTYTGSVTYDVKRPQATFTSATTSDNPAVNVGDTGFFGSGNRLHFGSFASRGITWTGTITTGANSAGQFAITQLVNVFAQKIVDDASGTISTWSSQNTFVLDQSMQYDGAVSINADATSTITRDDTPNTPAGANLKWVSDYNGFKTYLMYKPNGGDSIWITLQKLHWQWNGSATKQNGQWSLDGGEYYTPNPNGEPSSEFPEWSGRSIDIQWTTP